MLMHKRVLTLMAALVCLLGGCRAQTPYKQNDDPSPRPIASQSTVTFTTAEAAALITPSVVGLRTRSPDTSGQVVEGIGSGVIVSENGYILTNHHVAGSAWQVTVVFFDGTQKMGQVVWSHAALDLAIVKIDGKYAAAALGDSAQSQVGETVLAVGTPLNMQFQHTVTAGIISAKGRTLQVPTDAGETFMEDLLQTDASINAGNSGGPLVNLRGEVIGINTLKISEAEGMGFAIPIQVAAPIIRHFEQDGEYTTPYLGLYAYDAEIARYYDEDMSGADGLFVINIDPKGPGEVAGIQVGDVLISADGKRLATMLDLRVATYAHKVGEQMELSFMREGNLRRVKLTLEEFPL